MPYGVRKFELFGSVLRQDFDPERSDVDMLVEVRATRNRRLRHHIEQSKSPVYAAA